MLETAFTFCYQDMRFMSADIYTKAFSQVDDWVHARKLISVFAPDELTPSLLSQMLEDREQIAQQPQSDEPSGQGWSRVGKKRANKKVPPKAKSIVVSIGKPSRNNAAAAVTECCFAANACAAIDVAFVPDAMLHVSDMSMCVFALVQNNASEY